MRILTFACACVLSLSASEAVLASAVAANETTVAMDGGASTIEMKPNAAPLLDPEQDPGARSARAIECAQKADARGLQGKPRKRFLHECRSGV